MKICWDNLEGLYLPASKSKRLMKKGTSKGYYFIDSCKICGEEFLSTNKPVTVCSKECLSKKLTKTRSNGMYKGENNPRYGDHRNYEVLHGKVRSDEIIEIKPKYKTINDKTNTLKFEAAKEKFINKFKVITEEELKNINALYIDKVVLKELYENNIVEINKHTYKKIYNVERI